MNKTICLERLWVFSPAPMVALKADLLGPFSESDLREAILQACRLNGVSSHRLVVDVDGSAFFQPCIFRAPLMKRDGRAWQDIYLEQERIPFALGDGEFFRFFHTAVQGGFSVLLLAHHLAVDGISLTILVSEIQALLSGLSVTDMPLEPARLNEPVKLPWLTCCMIKGLNKKWQRKGLRFTLGNYQELFQSYWNTHHSAIALKTFSRQEYESIIEAAKKAGVPVDSLLPTLLLKAYGTQTSLGVTASFRKAGDLSLGNYASIVSITEGYDREQTFQRNAHRVAKVIAKQADDPDKRLFLPAVLKSISGSLVDSLYFQNQHLVNDQTSRTFCRMIRYDDIRLSDLGVIPSLSGDRCRVVHPVFVPPVAPDASRMVGALSMDGGLSLSLHAENDGQWEKKARFFDRLVNDLSALAQGGRLSAGPLEHMHC